MSSLLFTDFIPVSLCSDQVLSEHVEYGWPGFS